MNQFILGAVLDKIESDIELDEARILDAVKISEQENKYYHTEVWKMLGI